MTIDLPQPDFTESSLGSSCCNASREEITESLALQAPIQRRRGVHRDRHPAPELDETSIEIRMPVLHSGERGRSIEDLERHCVVTSSAMFEVVLRAQPTERSREATRRSARIEPRLDAGTTCYRGRALRRTGTMHPRRSIQCDSGFEEKRRRRAEPGSGEASRHAPRGGEAVIFDELR